MNQKQIREARKEKALKDMEEAQRLAQEWVDLIVEEREKQGISQREMADLLDLSQGGYVAIETKKSRIKVDQLILAIKILDIAHVLEPMQKLANIKTDTPYLSDGEKVIVKLLLTQTQQIESLVTGLKGLGLGDKIEKVLNNQDKHEETEEVDDENDEV